MIRIEKWRGPFAEEADKIKTKPFVWGEHDCAVGLVANLTKAITGEDKAASYRGRYSTAIGALRVMRKDGFENLADLVGSLLPEHEHISQARVGDIAAIPMPDSPFGYALGVVNGERILVLQETGIATMDLLDATRAFKVGD